MADHPRNSKDDELEWIEIERSFRQEDSAQKEDRTARVKDKLASNPFVPLGKTAVLKCSWKPAVLLYFTGLLRGDYEGCGAIIDIFQYSYVMLIYALIPQSLRDCWDLDRIKRFLIIYKGYI